MYILKRSGNLVGGEHIIYTEEEAKESGLVYGYWRDAMDVGDWFLTDDGMVVQCMAVKYYFDKRRTGTSRFDVYSKFMTFSCGRCTSFSRFFSFKNAINGMNNFTGKNFGLNFLNTRRGTLFVYTLAQMLLTKDVDYGVLKGILGLKEKHYIRNNIDVYIRNQYVMNKTVSIMSDYLKEHGITAESVLREYQEVKKKAIADGKYNDALKILDKFAVWVDLHGALSGQRRREEQLQNGVMGEIADRFVHIKGEITGNEDDAYVRMNSKGKFAMLKDVDGNRVLDIPLTEKDEKLSEKIKKQEIEAEEANYIE